MGITHRAFIFSAVSGSSGLQLSLYPGQQFRGEWQPKPRAYISKVPYSFLIHFTHSPIGWLPQWGHATAFVDTISPHSPHFTNILYLRHKIKSAQPKLRTKNVAPLLRHNWICKPRKYTYQNRAYIFTWWYQCILLQLNFHIFNCVAGLLYHLFWGL